ncbi:MAG: hypothetical protein R3C49_00510 [Planctomycetaceae bacterium]
MRTSFPQLGANFEVLGAANGTSPAPGGTYGVFNCIAWTLGVVTKWVNPETGPTTNILTKMDSLYASRGYTRLITPNYSLQSGFQKIAVYANRDARGQISITHGALQEADGTWTSKLGIGSLIRHQTPQALNGPAYGVPVAVYVRRTTYGWPTGSGSLAPSRMSTAPQSTTQSIAASISPTTAFGLNTFPKARPGASTALTSQQAASVIPQTAMSVSQRAAATGLQQKTRTVATPAPKLSPIAVVAAADSRSRETDVVMSDIGSLLGRLLA